MGSARHRSWSHSRHELFDRCQRAFFWHYYPWDEPNEAEARFLSRVQNHEMVAGDCIHWATALVLRAFQRDRTVVASVVDAAVRRYREICATSRWIVATREAGRRPPTEGVILHSHLYGYNDQASSEAAIANIERCLKNFHASEHLAFIQGTDPARWGEVDPPQARMPKFRLPDQPGVTVYAGYDLAFRHGDHVHVLDWKTGRQGSAAAQLATYALGLALRHPKPVSIERIRVQAVWLQNPGPWAPAEVDMEAVAYVKDRIRLLLQLEWERTRADVDARGMHARIGDVEDFPPSPSYRNCVSCKFAAMCSEGKSVVLAHRVDGASSSPLTLV